MKTFLLTLFGTALAEIAAVPFYYPFDLVKVRMQTMQATYGYTNFIDAVIKIWKEEKPKSKVISKIEIRKQLTFIGSIATRISKIRSFYAGAFYYALAYTGFIALEFALHDSFLEQIDEITGSKGKSIFAFL